MNEQPIEWEGRGAGAPDGEPAAAPTRRGHARLDGVGLLERFVPLTPSAPAASGSAASIVQQAVADHRDVGPEDAGVDRAVLVVSRSHSDLAGGLVALGEDVVAFRMAEQSHVELEDGGLGTERRALVLADVLSGGHGARQTLDAAYAVLRPGGLLVLTLETWFEQWGRRARRARRVRSARDILATLLFEAGFERPRFHRSSSGPMLVEAVRSAKEPPARRRLLLSVVMPVYNEQGTFTTVMDGLLAKEVDGIDLEIVVVESNSDDGTREQVLAYAEHPRVRTVLEERASGKGHAVRAGLAVATGDFVLIQDADLEYDLDDYDALLEPLRNFEASFVLGNRVRTDGARFGVRHFEKQVFIGHFMNLGNAMFLALFNLVYGARLRDPFTMYKVLRRDCLHGMILECDRFDFDWELTAKLLRAGYTPTELPVRYHSRSFDEGKKISILGDPLSWVVACFRYRFAPFEK